MGVYDRHFFTISIESFVLEKLLYSGWYKETMFCNYCRSKNKALLNKKLFGWCLSRILTKAVKHLVCVKSSKVMNYVLLYIYPLTLFTMGFFGAAHGWGGERSLLAKIRQTYTTMMKLGTVIPYIMKIQKICKSRDAHLEFCWHQHFFTGISKFCYIKK